MSSITRFGISLDASLLDRFDQLISEKGYANRSEAIRDLIRDALVRREWDDAHAHGQKVGTITLIYDHHLHDLSDRLTHLQHDYHETILSTMHVHLDHHNCLEIIAVKGEGALVQKLADELIGMKGVKHGKLVASTTGKDLK